MVRSARFHLYQVLGKGNLRNGSKREQGRFTTQSVGSVLYFLSGAYTGICYWEKRHPRWGKAQVGPGLLFLFFLCTSRNIF